ncbi:MAG TPA: trypsin-like peptidase domain-containing protein [Blastocatellia bacterium]|nr:trypsin-like peptidase domain-containing protein [Blastocatellia bacterium]
MYRISAKHLVLVAFISSLLTAGIFVTVQRAMGPAPAMNTNAAEPAAPAEPSIGSDEQNNIDVYRMVSPGVVNITSKIYQQGLFGVFPAEGTGSGSIIDTEGHILTNYHVVQDASELEVQIEDDKFPARVVGTDRDNDLAVIKVNVPSNYHLTVVKLGTSQGLQVGQKVLAIGNPFGLQRTLTTGIISGLERPLRDSVSRRTIQGAIQTDASINPGNSGGPLLNSRGEMIGINTAIYSPSGGSVGIGFAVPVDTAKKIIPDLIAKGYVSRPWMGISMMPLNRSIARQLRLPVQEGIIVGDVYRGSGAAAAGLRGAVISESLFGGIVLQEIGDIIVSVDGQKVANADDLQRALQDKHPGETVQVEVVRQGRHLTVPVRLNERPASDR